MALSSIEIHTFLNVYSSGGSTPNSCIKKGEI